MSCLNHCYSSVIHSHNFHGINAWIPDLLIILPVRVPTSPVEVRRVSATGSYRQRRLLLHLFLTFLLVTYSHCVLIPATTCPVVLSATGAVETKEHTVKVPLIWLCPVTVRLSSDLPRVVSSCGTWLPSVEFKWSLRTESKSKVPTCNEFFKVFFPYCILDETFPSLVLAWNL